MNSILASLRGGLIVSCQALPGNPLRETDCIARLAEAAALGGAAAIRANGVPDLTAIRSRVGIPLIGINKLPPDPDNPYITPTLESAREIAETGIEIIAVDATGRIHPNGETAGNLIRKIKRELPLLVMADISTAEEGVAAEDAGADLVATTLSGYTAYSPKTEGPDLKLVKDLAARLSVPVIAEGRFHSPEDVLNGFRAGAHAVVIGKMITNAMFITRYFLEQIRKGKS